MSKTIRENQFDVSDTPQEPTPTKRKGPPPIPDRRPAAKGRLPGVDPREPRLGFGKKEATIPNPSASKGLASTSRQRDPADDPATWLETEWDITDPRSGKIYKTTGRTPIDAKTKALQTVPELQGVDEWDIEADKSGATVRGSGYGRVSHPPEHGWGQSARTDWMTGDQPQMKIQTGDKPGRPSALNTQPLTGPKTVAGSPKAIGAAAAKTKRLDPQTGNNESTVGGSIGAGPQRPLSDGERELGEAIRSIVREIVRKKKSGGGYQLFSPNKGKKKDPKPVGEFPTRTRAKEVELQRFPPKDAEALKRARKRIDRLKKDPKKRAEKERQELGAKTKKRAKKEALDRMTSEISQGLSEALFREDDVPGSPWDERLASLSPDSLAADKKLHGFHKGVERGSMAALGDAHKSMAKSLRGLAKTTPGEPSFDKNRRKHFMPVMMDVDGQEVGPIHLYVDGGHCRLEISNDARGHMQKLEPDVSSNLRGKLISLQDDHFPKIDHAIKAVSARDAYLDKLHGKLDDQLGEMSPVQLHLARQLMNTKHRGNR